RGALEQLLDGSAPARRAGAPARESSGPGIGDDDDVSPLVTGASAASGRDGPVHPDGDATEGAPSPGAATGAPGQPSRPGATARPDAARRPSAPDPEPDGAREAVPGKGRSDPAAGAAEDAAADGGA